MSRVGVILGITELEVERVYRHRTIEVHARPTKRPGLFIIDGGHRHFFLN